ncbi:phage tail protein [Bradyrhizobium sp. 1050_B9_N1_2]|uniref:phage tail protein n=1 Tax=Bradyrhizobium sp. 1050_B9_N1_2 TaxID=3238688 RepID=UPI003EDC76A7
MAIFTLIATAISTAFFAGSAIATSLIAGGLALATSYAVRALTGQPQQQSGADAFGVQGKLAGGGDVPRSFGLGYHVTAGSLVYANTHGAAAYDTPNAFLTQVIALSDLPGERLVGLWVNGARVTIAVGDADYTNPGVGDLGYAVPEYIRPHNGEGSPTPHLWIKFYNGTQTAADAFVVAHCNSAERPYTSRHVGKGICYAVIHAFNDENLWSGFPTFKFELSGVPLYDPSRDSTVGGSGAHRYGDRSTWGGDGDNYPAVQIYNLLRGFSYGGAWLYGLQNMAAARLPVANWIAQIDKCRATVIGASGPEPSYRTGGQINVNAQLGHAIEALLTGCQGRISEIGGFYKIHLGAPDSPTFTFSDGDILSTETQVYRPFFSLADSVNGIQATYPDPDQGWNTATAPPYYREDLEALDGDRRLMADPSFDFVPFAEQVQRLQKSAIEEAQRARTHTLSLPPAFWIVEPGDVGEWTSARNGYVAKQFRVDAMVDRRNLDVTLSLTEVDPSDYDWDSEADFTPVTGGGTISNPPAPQAIDNFDAQPYTLVDSDGISRRPAILISWGVQPGISAVQFEVRLASDGSIATRGRSDRPTAGNLIITQSILPATDYQVRGQFVPSSPRDMLWSDWLDVTTPDVRFSLADFDPALTAMVTTIRDALQDQIDEALNRMASIASDIAARAPLDKTDMRSQLAARSADALAKIEEVRTVAVTTEAAYASFSTTASATWGSTTAFVQNSATAIATLDGYAAASWGVSVGADGVITGSIRIDGGDSWSAVTIRADKFQIQLPGINGDAPLLPFTIGTVNGLPAIGINGANMYLDRSIFASAIVAKSITAGEIAANTVTSDSGLIGALAVKSLSLADQAVTVPIAQSLGGNVSAISPGTPQSYFSFNLTVDTTGLAGKNIVIYASVSGMWANGSVATETGQFYLLINGSVANGYAIATPSGTLALVSLGGAINISASGGVMSIPVQAQFYANSATYMQAGTTIYAQAAKR